MSELIGNSASRKDEARERGSITDNSGAVTKKSKLLQLKTKISWLCSKSILPTPLKTMALVQLRKDDHPALRAAKIDQNNALLKQREQERKDREPELLQEMDKIIDRLLQARQEYPSVQSVGATASTAVDATLNLVCDVCGNRDPNNFVSDGRSGDSICTGFDGAGCGNVIFDHLVERGAEKRNFEGEEDRNHHGGRPDKLMPDIVNMETHLDVSKVCGPMGSSKDASAWKMLNMMHQNVDMNLSTLGNDERRTREGYKTKQKREAFQLMKEIAANFDIHDLVVEKAKEEFAKYRQLREALHQFEGVVGACMVLASEELADELQLDQVGSIGGETATLKSDVGSLPNGGYNRLLSVQPANVRDDAAISALPDVPLGRFTLPQLREWLIQVADAPSPTTSFSSTTSTTSSSSSNSSRPIVAPAQTSGIEMERSDSAEENGKQPENATETKQSRTEAKMDVNGTPADAAVKIDASISSSTSSSSSSAALISSSCSSDSSNSNIGSEKGMRTNIKTEKGTSAAAAAAAARDGSAGVVDTGREGKGEKEAERARRMDNAAAAFGGGGGGRFRRHALRIYRYIEREMMRCSPESQALSQTETQTEGQGEGQTETGVGRDAQRAAAGTTGEHMGEQGLNERAVSSQTARSAVSAGASRGGHGSVGLRAGAPGRGARRYSAALTSSSLFGTTTTAGRLKKSSGSSSVGVKERGLSGAGGGGRDGARVGSENLWMTTNRLKAAIPEPKQSAAPSFTSGGGDSISSSSVAARGVSNVGGVVGGAAGRQGELLELPADDAASVVSDAGTISTSNSHSHSHSRFRSLAGRAGAGYEEQRTVLTAGQQLLRVNIVAAVRYTEGEDIEQDEDEQKLQDCGLQESATALGKEEPQKRRERNEQRRKEERELEREAEGFFKAAIRRRGHFDAMRREAEHVHALQQRRLKVEEQYQQATKRRPLHAVAADAAKAGNATFDNIRQVDFSATFSRESTFTGKSLPESVGMSGESARDGSGGVGLGARGGVGEVSGGISQAKAIDRDSSADVSTGGDVEDFDLEDFIGGPVAESSRFDNVAAKPSSRPAPPSSSSSAAGSAANIPRTNIPMQAAKQEPWGGIGFSANGGVLGMSQGSSGGMGAGGSISSSSAAAGGNGVGKARPAPAAAAAGQRVKKKPRIVFKR